MRDINAHSRGSALVYILIAIALLAMMTALLMSSPSQNATAQNAGRLTMELKSQIDFIRSALQECVLNYSGGDTTMPVAPALVGGQNPVRPYPLMTTNTYLAAPVAGNLVTNIRCPGNPGNGNNHALIFGGTTGKFLPRKPDMFQDWVYYNNHDGVFIMTSATASDAYIDAALQKLDEQYARCELQYINNSGGAPEPLTAAADMNCAGGSKCIVARILMLPSAIYPGEVSACP